MWDILIITAAVIAFIAWAIKKLMHRYETKYAHQFTYKCYHDEPNHDRIACYQQRLIGVGIFFIFLAIAPKH